MFPQGFHITTDAKTSPSASDHYDAHLISIFAILNYLNQGFSRGEIQGIKHSWPVQCNGQHAI
ncbi:MAG: hypothetical protein A2029_13740 [Chloroflexi bacterium RBG_19FT_COMBO_47_9]|nr:MAG: hypothetical protein A2029_13740 [Chloroflexi bacterium RBG_19FT_COMBO_47_9]